MMTDRDYIEDDADAAIAMMNHESAAVQMILIRAMEAIKHEIRKSEACGIGFDKISIAANALADLQNIYSDAKIDDHFAKQIETAAYEWARDKHES